MSSSSRDKIDVVIPYHEKDSEIIEMCITGCVNNVHNLGNIYVVTKSTDLAFDGAQVIDEDKLFNDGLNKKYIESRWSTENPDLVWRSGWFFQQFIKIGCSYAISNLSEHYLVVDADVVFLRRVHFFKDGRTLLAKTTEYHKPHFNCCEMLLGESINREHAFVAHHMPMCKSIVCELLDGIEKRFNKTWYDAILDNIDNEKNLIFSEYETYGHYLENRYPEKLVVRRLRNVQRFKVRHLLKVFLNLADYATIHDYKKPRNNPKTDPWIYELFIRLVRSKLQIKKTKTEAKHG